MIRRIACIGASGVGKSRLVERLRTKLNLPINPVGSRSVALCLGFNNVYDVDKAGLRNVFQRRLFTDKVQWETEHEEFLTDRTVFDNLAYAMVHGGTEMMTVEELSKYITSMHRYTAIFYLPLNVFQNISDDQNRLNSDVYHQMFDMIIRALIIEYSIPNVITLRCPLEERASIIDGLLEEEIV
jgi:nicotinamide riboside kinase